MQFPVWRELKLYVTTVLTALLKKCLNAVSRLKGIETKSRWHILSWQFSCLNAVSRLKGIETQFFAAILLPLGRFECSFPFEGNWNYSFSALISPSTCVWMQFPVWRELKQSKAFSSCNSFRFVWMQFPVWRELKRQRDSVHIQFRT